MARMRPVYSMTVGLLYTQYPHHRTHCDSDLGMRGLILYSSRGGRGDVQGGGGDGGGSLEGGLIFFHTTMLSSSSSSMLAVAPVSSSVVASAGILKSENVFFSITLSCMRSWDDEVSSSSSLVITVGVVSVSLAERAGFIMSRKAQNEVQGRRVASEGSAMVGRG